MNHEIKKLTKFKDRCPNNYLPKQSRFGQSDEEYYRRLAMMSAEEVQRLI
jgi:hypothetical protein